MTSIFLRPLMIPALAVVMAATAYSAVAQDTPRPPGNLLDRIFRGNERASEPVAQDRAAQGGSNELMVRIDRLEGQIRQLTGVIEELQHRNQQLEAQVRRVQEDTEYRFQELRGGARTPPPATRPSNPAPVPSATPVQPPAPAQPGRRGDAFDPTQNPNAPGAPRVLGSLPTSPQAPLMQPQESANAEPPVGAPGGRGAGAPLDLSTLTGRAANDPGLQAPGAPGDGLPPPPPRNSSATGAQVATLPPSDSPKDSFDLAYGYLVRKDYALAEQGFRNFLKTFPADRMTAEAQYWLGESLFQRQRYRDAAEEFLNVSTKYETTAKAPDALLRLGQSLAGLGEKEAACASLAEVMRKYPRASVSIKQGVEREQKRVRC